MISTAFLSEVANLANSKIDKVVLNGGEYEISNFTTKSVTDSIVTMNYIVPLGSVETVTRIELKNDDDVVLSDNTVNIPISADTLLIQTIIVSEVG